MLSYSWMLSSLLDTFLTPGYFPYSWMLSLLLDTFLTPGCFPYSWILSFLPEPPSLLMDTSSLLEYFPFFWMPSFPFKGTSPPLVHLPISLDLLLCPWTLPFFLSNFLHSGRVLSSLGLFLDPGHHSFPRDIFLFGDSSASPWTLHFPLDPYLIPRHLVFSVGPFSRLLTPSIGSLRPPPLTWTPFYSYYSSSTIYLFSHLPSSQDPFRYH
jgi:hypothetical protein